MQPPKPLKKYHPCNLLEPYKKPILRTYHRDWTKDQTYRTNIAQEWPSISRIRPVGLCHSAFSVSHFDQLEKGWKKIFAKTFGEQSRQGSQKWFH